MMTPQEAESHVFSKAAIGGGGGYNMAQVDAFLDTLIADYAQMFEETTSLKAKMKTLVDKIEEYRETEDAMRKTLLAAQKMADTMVKEAEAKKSETLTQAVVESKKRIEEVRRELANEEARLQAAKNSTDSYVAKLKDLYTRELEYIGRLAEMSVVPGKESQNPVSVKEIEAQMEKYLGEEHPAPAVQPTAAPVNDAPITPVIEDVAADDAVKPDPALFDGDDSATMVFDPLQFGKNYEFE